MADRTPSTEGLSLDPFMRQLRQGEPAAWARAAEQAARVVGYRSYAIPEDRRAGLVRDVLATAEERLRDPGFGAGRPFDAWVRSLAYVRCIGWLRERRADAEGGEGDHPGPREVTDYVLARETLSEEDLVRVEGHLATCTACTDEIESIGRIEATAGARPDSLPAPSRPPAPVPLWAGFTAVVAVVAIGFAMWLGLYRVPHLATSHRQRIERSEQETESMRALLDETRRRLEAVSGWSGPVGLAVVSGSHSGPQRPAPVLPLAEGQPFAAVSVGPIAVDNLDPAAGLACRVLGPDGEVVWSDTRSVAAHRSRMGSSPFATYLIPAESLTPGSYSLELALETGSGESVLVEGSFRTLRLTP